MLLAGHFVECWRHPLEIYMSNAFLTPAPGAKTAKLYGILAIVFARYGIVLRGTGGSGPRSPTGTRVVCGEGPMRMVVWRMTPGSALLSAVSAAAAEGNRSAGS